VLLLLHTASEARRALRAQERSKRQVVAAGGGLADAELELMWNWNIHTRRHPIHANSQARTPAAPWTARPASPARRAGAGFKSACAGCATGCHLLA